MATLAIAALTTAGASAAGVSLATATTIASVGGTIMTGVSALATIAGGIGEYQQGKAQQAQADLNARRTEMEGRMDAVTTNEELLRTLSMNTVAAAAGGLTGEGSAQRAQEQSQANAARQLSISKMNTESEAEGYRAEGRSAKGRGTAGLLGSFVSAGSSVYGAGKTIKKTK